MLYRTYIVPILSLCLILFLNISCQRTAKKPSDLSDNQNHTTTNLGVTNTDNIDNWLRPLLSEYLSGESIKPVNGILDYPIMFVTQVPIPEDFTTIGSTFGNHLATLQSVGRGGDLWILYPDGVLRNLTKEAGFGVEGFQNENAIAVRDPAVHWTGNKAIFSMVIGAPNERYVYEDYYWQLYEITGLAKNDTPVITKVAKQPADFNNVSPIYDSADNILFTSDRPRNGQRHLYPQLDEYEEAPTNTGMWKLNPVTGNLNLLDHSPSGDFSPMIDSFGRVIFTRWDHLIRDQQADSDALNGGACTYCTFNYSSEALDSVPLSSNEEIFPEPRDERIDLLAGTNLLGHDFNHFLPWMMNQDGTELETLNHIGRHELHAYFNRSRNDDALSEWYQGAYNRTNSNSIQNFFQINEDPNKDGYYLGINAPEFGTHASGQIVALDLPVGKSPDDMMVDFLTHPDTATTSEEPSQNHSGLYREPLKLSNSTLISVHANTTYYDTNIGSRISPNSYYDFRLKILKKEDGYWVSDKPLTTGIKKNVSYFDPDEKVTYNDFMWELNPVEVKPKLRPEVKKANLPNIEAKVFQEVGINLNNFQDYLIQNDLALIISRNVTIRDDGDKQQPFNLKIAGSSTEATQGDGQIYELSYMQFFQAEQLRGLTYGNDEPIPGRRVIAQHMNISANPNIDGPQASVQLGADGSMAAFVPAERALSWQLTNENGEGIVLERNWLTFQAGEVRVCGSCHGLNDTSQTGSSEPTNSPEALKDLLNFWKNNQ